MKFYILLFIFTFNAMGMEYQLRSILPEYQSLSNFLATKAMHGAINTDIIYAGAEEEDLNYFAMINDNNIVLSDIDKENLLFILDHILSKFSFFSGSYNNTVITLKKLVNIIYPKASQIILHENNKKIYQGPIGVDRKRNTYFTAVDEILAANDFSFLYKNYFDLEVVKNKSKKRLEIADNNSHRVELLPNGLFLGERDENSLFYKLPLDNFSQHFSLEEEDLNNLNYQLKQNNNIISAFSGQNIPNTLLHNYHKSQSPKKESLKRSREEEDSLEKPNKKGLNNSGKEKVKRSYNLAKKYFEEEEEFLEKLKGNHRRALEKSKVNSSKNINFISLGKFGDSQSDLAPSIQYINAGDNYLKLLYKHDEALKLNEDDFLVTVLLGRGLNAFEPPIEDKVKVLLVITQKEYEENQQAYHAVINRGYSLLIIKNLSLYNKQMEERDLGLVTSRRLASLIFAKHMKAKNLLMLDDNLEKIYFSNKIENESFYGLLESFKVAAKENNYALLSLRQVNYQMDRKVLDGNSKIKDQTFGAKIFYFNLENMKNTLASPHEFFPPEPGIWGEDLYMQVVFLVKSLNVGVFDRRYMLLKRHYQQKNLCKKSLKKLANRWIDDESLKESFEKLNDEAKEAFEIVKDIVHENLIKRKQEQEEIKKLHLAQPLGKTLNNEVTTKEIDNKKYIEKFFDKELHNLINKQETSPILFYHQQKALQDLDKNKEEIGYFSMAVGSGKSMVINMIIYALMNKKLPAGKNIALLLPNIQLLDQACEAILKFNSIMQENNKKGIDLDRVITISSMHVNQKYLSVNEEFEQGGNLVLFCNKSFDNYFKEGNDKFIAILVDEFHLLEQNIAEKLPKNDEMLLYGFSATPIKNKSVFNKYMIFNYSKEQGIEDNILVPYKEFYFGETYEINGIKITIPKTTNSEEFIQFLENFTGDDGFSLSEKGGLIFKESVKKVEGLTSFLKNYGFLAESITSENSNEDNEKYIKQFIDADLNILIAAYMLQEGFDAPVDYIIIDRECSNVEQVIGRALRPFGDENKIAYIFRRKPTE